MKTQYTAEQIQSLEKELSEFFQSKGIYMLQPKTDIVKMAVQLGFGVYSVALKDRIDGIIYVENHEKKIGVNNKISGNYLQFVVAHELGHYIRQLKENHGNENNMFFALKDSIFHNDDKTQLENEMDYLAAAMLVPMWHFSKQIKALGIGADINYNNVDEKVSKEIVDLLANYYCVNGELIRRRIAEAVEYGRIA